MADYTSAYTGAEVDEYLEFALNGAAKSAVGYDHGNNNVVSSTNISSVTDDATGQWTANFTNNMNTTREPLGQGMATNGTSFTERIIYGRDHANWTTGAYKMQGSAGSGGSDWNSASIVVTGDLA